MPREELLKWLVGTAVGAPLLAFVVLGLWVFLLGRREEKDEHVVAVIAAVGQSVSFAAACAAAIGFEWFHYQALPVFIGHWFRSGTYTFEVELLVDRLSLAMMVLTAGICGLVGRFAVPYLHRERGYTRFFLLLCAFSAGMQVLVLGDSYDILFAGWEIVGLTSMLLIGFFYERNAPTRAALRAFVTYRLCDVGLLIGAVVLHQSGGSAEFDHAFGVGMWPTGAAHLPVGAATAVALLITLSAAGKSAQFPVGGWLPRAMEGPTPSSALFYGGLSVHAGAYLLLRSAPLFERSPVASAVVLAIGAITAVRATLIGQVQSDAKGILAYAIKAQVGLMFVEVGLGFYTLALWHLIAHACLRCFQLLRAPSALRDEQLVRAANDGRPLDTPTGVGMLVPERMRRFGWRLAFERFQLDTFQERLIVGPVLWLGAGIDRFERAWIAALSGWTREAEAEAKREQVREARDERKAP